MTYSQIYGMMGTNLEKLMRQITGIIVHCSATPQDIDIGADEIRQWHKAKGWSDIGYHYVIRRDGALEEGRPVELVGAHAKGHNTGTIGICLVGGTDAENKDKAEANYTISQYIAVYNLILHLIGKYGLEITDVKGHRDLPGVAKACPCFDVQGLFS